MSIVAYNNRSIANISAVPGAATSLILIKTVTVSSATANVTFVNGSSDVILDDTYPIYRFVFINCLPSSDGVKLNYNFSVDTGSNLMSQKLLQIFMLAI